MFVHPFGGAPNAGPSSPAPQDGKDPGKNDTQTEAAIREIANSATRRARQLEEQLRQSQAEGQAAVSRADQAEARVAKLEEDAARRARPLVRVTQDSLQVLNRKQLDALQDELRTASGRVEHCIRESVPVCAICEEHDPDVCLVPCGHRMCHECVQHDSIKDCPFCRTAIKQRIRLRDA